MIPTIVIQVLVLILLSVPVFPQETISFEELKKRIANSKKTKGKSAKPEEKIKLSDLESNVFAEINTARSTPEKYIEYLNGYKKLIRNNILYRPNKAPVQMLEGVSAIDEAISTLQNTKALAGYKLSNGLTKVAQGHLKDLKEDSNLGHFGKDGSNLKTRLLRLGSGVKKASENITEMHREARVIVLNMIIDDGIKSRMHRTNIMNSKYNYFGVACGDDKKKKMICVMVFADNFHSGADANKPQIKSF